MSFDQLPYNVIIQIIWCISSNKSNFAKLRRVCKRIAEITRDNRYGNLVTCGKGVQQNGSVDINHCTGVKFSYEPKWISEIKYVDRLSCFLLSQKDKDIDQIMSDYTWKCSRYDIDTLKYFIENGADIRSEKEWIMLKAAYQGNIEVVKFLVSYGADIHVEEDIIVISAARGGNVKLLRYLIDCGIDIHSHYDGAIIEAAIMGNLEMVKFLVSNGFNFEMFNVLDTVQFDDIVNSIIKSENLDLAKYLMEHGIDMSSEYTLALEYSIRQRKTDTIKFLISSGAEIDDKKDGIISCAVDTGDVELIKCLMDRDLETRKYTLSKMALWNAMSKKMKKMY